MTEHINKIDDLMRMVVLHQSAMLTDEPEVKPKNPLTINLPRTYYPSVGNMLSSIFNASVFTGLLALALLRYDSLNTSETVMCTHVIIGNNVNIRMGAGLSFLELYELNRGDLIAVTDFKNDVNGDIYRWAQFINKKGVIGFNNYVREDLVEALNTPKLCG